MHRPSWAKISENWRLETNLDGASNTSLFNLVPPCPRFRGGPPSVCRHTTRSTLSCPLPTPRTQEMHSRFTLSLEKGPSEDRLLYWYLASPYGRNMDVCKCREKASYDPLNSLLRIMDTTIRINRLFNPTGARSPPDTPFLFPSRGVYFQPGEST